MRGIKIPQQDFALKMPGGLMREGGIFAGHYGTQLICVRTSYTFHVTSTGYVFHFPIYISSGVLSSAVL